MEVTLQKDNNTALVKDVMTKEVVTVSVSDTMLDAKTIMKNKSISGLPVVDNDLYLLGVISVADIIIAMEENSINDNVCKYMTKKVVSVGWNATVGQALKAFRKYKFGRFPVINEKGQVVGIITPSDVVTRLAQYLGIDSNDDDEEYGITHNENQGQNFGQKWFEYNINNVDMDHTGEGASQLKKVLLDLGISRQIVRRSAIAAYEAEMNVMIHAYGGKMTASISPECITITVEDNGPGIKDLSKAIQRGFSTAPEEARKMGFGAGMGLPNIKASSDEFYIESSPMGTRLIVKIMLK